MIFIYPAVFRKKEDDTYEGYFPDLEDCFVKGNTLDDAVDNATEAASNWLTVELEDENCQLPYVSDEEDLDLSEGDIFRNIMVHIRFYEGWDE